ncbi:MAG: hypothetical protein HY538_09275 [Deltaproteobacteria bacterium]|nr:hypothetical protein [Deltaproteobacteria bacterium]
MVVPFVMTMEEQRSSFLVPEIFMLVEASKPEISNFNLLQAQMRDLWGTWVGLNLAVIVPPIATKIPKEGD